MIHMRPRQLVTPVSTPTGARIFHYTLPRAVLSRRPRLPASQPTPVDLAHAAAALRALLPVPAPGAAELVTAILRQAATEVVTPTPHTHLV